MDISPFSRKRNSDGMPTSLHLKGMGMATYSPCSLNENGDGMAISPFYLKGMRLLRGRVRGWSPHHSICGHLSILSKEEWGWHANLFPFHVDGHLDLRREMWMDTSPFFLTGNGDGIATSPFYLKGMRMAA